MDRREAIDVIRLMKHQLDRDVTIYDGFLFEALTQVIEKQHEALDLAIEALRGDFHCPKCGTIVRDDRQCHDLVYRGEAEVTDTDLISRQAAIEVLSHVKDDEKWRSECVDNEIRLIQLLPPVEPKRPKGMWIGEGDGYADGGIVYDTWYCSECDHCEEGEELALPNYCPNCGAKMKEVIE